MRKFSFILIFIASFFISESASAVVYPLTAVQNGNVVMVQMSGVTDTTSDFNLFDGNTPVPAPEAVNTNGMIKKAINGSVIWEIKGIGFKNNYTYYLNVKKIVPGIVLAYESVTDVKSFKTGTGGDITFYTGPTVTDTTGQTAKVKGKIDLTKYPNISNLKIEFKLSLTPGIGSPNTYPSQTADGATTSLGIASDGSYYLNLNGLTPSTPYYLQQNIYEGTNTTPIATKIVAFDSSKGLIPEGGVAVTKDNSYHLLAPWPGLSVLMDPDVCLYKKNVEKSISQNAICDINGFINFAFKILIGLTSVILVLRLMYEGYQYMVTDIPFLKASAKSNFFTALMGLLLALSAYLILNTINPKLVTNTFNVASVEVGVSEEELEGEAESTTGGAVVKITKSKIKYDKEYSSLNACPGTGGNNTNPNSATCIKYDTSIPRSASGQYLEKGFAEKVKKLNQLLISKNITWRVTEAWPGSRVHKAKCHQIGVCIDMNHTTGGASNQNPTVAQVKAIIESAASLGMCAQYEIKDNATLKNQLIAAGLGKNVLFFNGRWISANHYSLYNGTCI